MSRGDKLAVSGIQCGLSNTFSSKILDNYFITRLVLVP